MSLTMYEGFSFSFDLRFGLLSRTRHLTTGLEFMPNANIYLVLNEPSRTMVK